MSMVETVARALCLRTKNAPPESYPDGYVEKYVNRNWDLFVDIARAAIEAMRVPTEDMKQRGGRHLGLSPQDGASVASAWNAMIDAALE